jgi:hypothetical protein
MNKIGAILIVFVLAATGWDINSTKYALQYDRNGATALAAYTSTVPWSSFPAGDIVQP